MIRADILICSVLVLLFASKALPEAPKQKLEISPETTRLVGPLRPDGSVDYVAVLTASRKRGVTPENNVHVLLVRAMGPKAVPTRHADQFYAELGIEPLPEDGEYFLLEEEFRRKHEGEFSRSDFDTQMETANEGYWSGTQLPLMERWMKENEKPLALIKEALKRPKSYIPLIPGESLAMQPGARSTTIAQITNFLMARVQRKLNDGDVDEAWADIITGIKLSRHLGTSSDRGCLYAALGIPSRVLPGIWTLAHSKDLSAEEALRMRKELKSLSASSALVDEFDEQVRYDALSMLADCASLGAGSSLSQHVIVQRWLTPDSPRTIRALDAAEIDWNAAAREIHVSCDQFVQMMKMADPIARREREKELSADRHYLISSSEFQQWYDAVFVTCKNPKERGRALGRAIVGMCKYLDEIVDSELARKAQFDMAEVWLALAAFRADNEERTFPDKLSELVPKYLPKIPKDPFSPANDLGYAGPNHDPDVYSVFTDGRDDRGSPLGDLNLVPHHHITSVRRPR